LIFEVREVAEIEVRENGSGHDDRFHRDLGQGPSAQVD